MGRDPATLLTGWRSLYLNEGYELPSAEDLLKIAAVTPGPWPADLHLPSVEPWRPTIEFILHQAKMGVVDPVSQLPIELRAPVSMPQPPAASPTGPPLGPARKAEALKPEVQQPISRPVPPISPNLEHPVSGFPPAESSASSHPAAPTESTEPKAVEVLLAWKRGEQSRNQQGIGVLDDTTLRRIGRNIDLSEQAIRAQLRSDSQRSFVPKILQALAAAGLGASGPAGTPSQQSGYRYVPFSDPAERDPAVPQVAPTQSHFQTAAVQSSTGPNLRDQGVSHQRSPDYGDPGQAPTAGTAIDPNGFADLDFSVEQPAQPAGLLAVPMQGSGIQLSWESSPHQAPVVIYRVVAGDDYAPYAPDQADVISVTTGLDAVDPRPNQAAVRYLQVWSNSGATEIAAKMAQPRLIAARSMVAPVQRAVIREDTGKVIGQWEVFDGVEEVQVYRIPLGRGPIVSANPQNRILRDKTCLGGFVDSDAERGQRYLYQVFAVARVNDVSSLSTVFTASVTVTAQLTAIQDLEVDLLDTGNVASFDLRWTGPSAGRVLVFRTKTGPTAGADAEPIDEAALGQTRLTEEDLVTHPVDRGTDGRMEMRHVPWPDGWTRAFFTPVTVLEGKALVGRTVTRTRQASVMDAEVVERVNKQILTFTWPAGATSVLVYQGPSNGDPAQARLGASHELNRHDWELYGGLSFNEPLFAGGCALHLVPVAFDAGERIEGAVTSVEYPWLARISYQSQIKRNLMRRPASVLVSLTCDYRLDNPPAFVLLHNEVRLPLDIHDGQPLPVAIEGDQTSEPRSRIEMPVITADTGELRWRADVTGKHGYVRLFIDLPTEHYQRYALLDPSISGLSLRS